MSIIRLATSSRLRSVSQKSSIASFASVGTQTLGFGGVQKRPISLLHFVLQLTNLEPKPPWASGTVVLEGSKKAHFFITLCTTTDEVEAQTAVGTSRTVVLEGVTKGSFLYYTLYYN